MARGIRALAAPPQGAVASPLGIDRNVHSRAEPVLLAGHGLQPDRPAVASTMPGLATQVAPPDAHHRDSREGDRRRTEHREVTHVHAPADRVVSRVVVER